MNKISTSIRHFLILTFVIGFALPFACRKDKQFPKISVAPAYWDFGVVPVGTDTTQTFIIRNTGDADLHISAPVLSGPDAAVFTLIGGGGSVTLAPLDTQHIIVRFAPVSLAGAQAVLEIHSDDPDNSLVSIQLSGGGSAPGPYLEVEPSELFVIPEEELAFNVYLVDQSGARTLLAPELLQVSVANASSEVVLEQGRRRIDVFGNGDVGANGRLLISYGGLEVELPFSLISFTQQQLQVLDYWNAELEAQISAYNDAKAAFKVAADSFRQAHEALYDNATGDEFLHETFVFNTTWGSLLPVGSVLQGAPVAIIRYPGIPISEADAFFKLIDGSSTFTLVASNTAMSSGGVCDELPCPITPGPESGCFKLQLKSEITLNDPPGINVKDIVFKQHAQVADQAITALSMSYIHGPTGEEAGVIYMIQPPYIVGSLKSDGGEISMVVNCDGVESWLPVTTSPDVPASITWSFDYPSRSREDFTMKLLKRTEIRIGTSRYTNLARAEKMAQQALANLTQRQAELALRKIQAMEDLKNFQAATDSFRQFWADRLQAMSDDLGSYVSTLHSELKKLPGIPDDVKENIDGVKGQWDKGQATADLFILMKKADDPNLTSSDRLLAVKKAFDIGRILGPGGPIVDAIAPFLNFYSEALAAVAVAVEKIEALRKEQVLATGEYDLIEVIVADPDMRKRWQDAFKLRQLMQRLRDP
ncbi:MAG: choice-of-anchor D domain-containing protein [Bacteroidetes bacterium]|nr:MAG: choice-of-anchor D domain-containing protein [Bacteroidota bacterium]